MKIAVCIKQTPAPSEARFDDETKTLVREGVTLTMSSIDRRALLEGLRLRDEVGGTLTVVTLGPPQARAVLEEAMGLGADNAVHINDSAFAGSDTLATSRALAMALRKLDPDLVLTGKFTVDSETGQVPGEIAEHMGIPQLTSARAIKPTDRDNVLWVERETDDGYEHYEVPLPALMSVVEFIITGRRPSPEDMEAGRAKPLEEWNVSDLQADAASFGKEGSPTWVAELRSAELERNGTIINGDDAENAAQALAAYLMDNGLFEDFSRRETSFPRPAVRANPNPSKAIWTVAELGNGEPLSVTYELLGQAQQLAEKLGGEVAAVLIGGADVDRHVASLTAHGADKVYVAADNRLATYDTDIYTAILATAVQTHKPHAVFLSSSTNGRDLGSRLAARLEVGLTGDCISLEIDPTGEIAQIKPAFGGNIVSPIYSKTIPVMATVRPGMLDSCIPDWDINPHTIALDLSADVTPRVKLLDSGTEVQDADARLDNASVVVSAGMGIGGPENLPAIRTLADTLGGALAATLRTASNKWLAAQVQIGLTGKAVAPRFYIAIGVSGAPNHLVGVRKAEHIIAINNNPEAAIFKAADFGIVGDWSEIVPALTRIVQEAKKKQPVAS